MSIKIDLNKPIEEDGGWLLLAYQTINDRSVLCWYNSDTKNINMSFFHLLERPNEMSKNVQESQWGWMTHFVDNIKTEAEATEIINLYLEDIKNDNAWWEKH